MSQNLAAIPCFIVCKMVLSKKLGLILSLSHNTEQWINGTLMVTKSGAFLQEDVATKCMVT